jgi:hypothetical protein
VGLVFNSLNAELNHIRHLLALVGAHHFVDVSRIRFNPLNAELNPIRHLLALAGAHHFVHVSRIRVNPQIQTPLVWNVVILNAEEAILQFVLTYVCTKQVSFVLHAVYWLVRYTKIWTAFQTQFYMNTCKNEVNYYVSRSGELYCVQWKCSWHEAWICVTRYGHTKCKFKILSCRLWCREFWSSSNVHKGSCHFQDIKIGTWGNV